MPSNPVFLCVGPERTGTTWLYNALSKHPDIGMPPIKEIKYFYETQWYPNETVLQRFLPGDFHNEYYREQLAIFLKERKHVKTYLRYLLSKRSLQWYLSLFPEHKVSGDISPQYFALPINKLKEIRYVLPNVKIIINVRNPIEWSWAMARMSEDYTNLDYRDRFPTVQNIERWQAIFPHVLVTFFDRLVEEPEAYFHEICEFIGIARVSPPSVGTNSGKPVPMPDAARAFLTALWQSEIECLADRYAPYPKRWLEASTFLYRPDAPSQPPPLNR